MNASYPLVTVIIPNWNGRHLLESCLKSIRNQTFQNFSVIVVDNGSTDGSLSWIRANHDDIVLVRLPENRGFGAAVNAGIRLSTSPLIFLLNNDTELDKNCLDELVHAAMTRPGFDSFAPKMLNYFDRSLMDGAGDGMFRGGAGYRLGTFEIDDSRFDCSKPVFGCCAGAALYRRTFFEKTGLFDDAFFAYLEDVDLNLHACRLGLHSLYVPSARVFHMGSMTSGSRLNPFTVRLTTRNLLQVIVKNYPLSILLSQFPVILLYHLWWFCVCLSNRLVFAHAAGILGGIKQLPEWIGKRKKRMSVDGLDVAAFWKAVSVSEQDVMASIFRRRKHANRVTWPIALYMRLFWGCSPCP